ncbi:hypothetical protein [Shimia sp.]|jgi:hypothetical protein|uniref:hypothetical protein n=1 Tax=unclassified Shimia TaxID=2630038 RepID=UPI0025F2280F|nr:hypothetical protein [Shimia sp.]MCH2067500.1 hypothetical protein [Shimia sp.]
MRHLLPALIAALVMAALIALDIARPLGAHPWWSQKTLLVGAPIGLILATLAGLKLRPISLTVTLTITTALAFATAKYGQTQFAASYAEDALAGKLWYFGWIATGATLGATFTAIVSALFKTRRPDKPR